MLADAERKRVKCVKDRLLALKHVTKVLGVMTLRQDAMSLKMQL
jgi:hypothetical protein